MFRASIRPRRVSALTFKQVPIGVRFSSTQTSTSNSSRYLWLPVAAIGVGAGTYLLNGKAPAKSLSEGVPDLKELSSEDQIPVNSPIKSIILDDANAKLREDAHTFVFKGNAGVKGRVDFARLGSNNPIEDNWDLKMAKGVGGVSTLYAGVYDGHAGWATSQVLRTALVPYVSGALAGIAPTSSGDLVDDAIKKAFVRLDDRIFSNAETAVRSGQNPGSASVISAVAPAIAGSCALLTIYDPSTSTLRTAVTGDSRAVRGAWSSEAKKYETDALSIDQTGFNKDEVDRLDKEHPGELQNMIKPESGRLFGLAVTRAFGDHRFKWPEELVRKVQEEFYGTAPRPKALTQPYLTARPEVTTRKTQTEDFVIMGSDGLWDMISNEDAVTCVSRWLIAKKNGKPEPFKETKFEGRLDDGWKATPEHQVIEDLDNAAVCLVKNAFGGSRRGLFLGAMTTYSPMSREVRDDITVQVIFFKDPYNGFIVRMGRPPYRPFDKIFEHLAPHCKIIASAAAGYDDFGVDWLTQKGIWLCNSVDAVAEATADMAFFLVLAVVRDTYRGERSLREGNWRGPVVPSRDPWGMTLGIIGMGAIGKCLARRALAFNMRIKYYNRTQLSAEDEAKYEATYCTSLHELLAQSDVVSINCPLTRETENLISTKEFSIMKDGAFIVNTARGAIIDEAALIEALESGKITRAGLDVFLNEPDLNEYFKTSDKVVIQPHVAGLTDLAFQRGEREAFENVKALFKTGSPISPVNFPEGHNSQDDHCR
ncbi:hypothetical protein FGRMN_4556 [Fusarium graminum]|nr:hypothetical protein FGRMN_4556 [Fusarium graminum]